MLITLSKFKAVPGFNKVALSPFFDEFQEHVFDFIREEVKFEKSPRGIN